MAPSPPAAPDSPPPGQAEARALREALRQRDSVALDALLGPATGDRFNTPVELCRAAAARIPVVWLRHLAEDFCALAPRDPAVLQALARVWREHGGWSAAEQTLRHALAADPRHLASLRDLAEILHLHARLGEALRLLAAALALHPGDPVLLTLAGQCHLAQGEHETALAAFQLAAENARAGQPELAARAGLLFVLGLAYLPDVTAADLRAAAADWENHHAPPIPRRPPAPVPSPAPSSTPTLAPARRRLRIGYYSPDFRRHSIAHFFLPLLRQHDRAAFEIFLYSDTPATDRLTDIFRELADHWRELPPLSEAQAVRRIAEDRLDLLVDLAGFFGATRPRLFAARPAPRQIHLLGYHGSTGLSSLDHRITDALCDPPGCEAESSETVVRVPQGFHCFDPLVPPLDEGPPPCLHRGHVTFGSCNTLPKINAEVVALWSRVLHAVPRSRLLIKAIQLHDAELRQALAARFAAHGISAERLEILPGASDPEAHLAAYRHVDIALDPFPCNGVTTTCEALWMGVPVLTLPGSRHSARVGSSLLTQIGLPECIATSAEDFVRRACDLAAAPARLAELRTALRARLAASSLGDAPAYARRIEAAYRDLIFPNT